MRASLRKLRMNYGWRALSVLGPYHYFRMLVLTLRVAPSLLRSGELRAVDRAMGKAPMTLRYRGRRLHLDAPSVDAQVQDGTYVFGAVRELMIRDCYLRRQPRHLYGRLRSVVDLGANRGVFSLMVSPVASRLVSVDFQPDLLRSIEAIMANASDVAHTPLRAFVGHGGTCVSQGSEQMTLPQLLDDLGLHTVDLVKLDIEGSEFSLFENDTSWLDRVTAISMEVHPKHGRVSALLETLTNHGFTHLHVDHLFRSVNDPEAAEFVYAYHPMRLRRLRAHTLVSDHNTK